MLLGKRPRPPMKRTTSMTEFALDLAAIEEGPQLSDRVRAHHHDQGIQLEPSRNVVAVASPRRGSTRRSSADFTALETAAFLKACGLCQRRLGPGRDIFMYRGEIAFCSLECRQHQINLDERKEKFSTSPMKDGAELEASGGGEVVAA